MPSEIIGQRNLSPSFYLDEMRFPAAEKQMGFRKLESVHNHHGIDRILQAAESKSFVSSPLEKFLPVGTQSVGSLEHPQTSALRGLNAKICQERTNNLPTGSWISMDQSLGIRSNMFVQSASHFVEGNAMNGAQHENGLFSSSLSEMFSKKLRLLSNDVPFGQSVDAMASHYDEGENFESLKEIEAQTIGSLLPDDDLLSGVFDDLEYIAQPNGVDDIEEFDLFSSGGGMELEGDDERKRNPDASGGFPGGADGASVGEHPNGEHPSRTLFVRNINSNVDDSELKALFEQYGDIRTLYTACKHRGFVMICYYDIRGSCNAMRALQNKPLRRRKLDIHFSIPKDNPSDRDINQGTLVVFNLDSSVSNDYLRQVFGIYGEIKEIRETPYKRHHKFIEYYDIRAAEAALRALNRTDIAGKRIKLEPSRPGGARRLMQQLSPELEHEETEYRQHGIPPSDSTLDCLESVVQGMSTSSCMENGSLHGIHSRIRPPISQLENGFHQGISSIPNSLPSQITVGSRGHQSGLGELAHSLSQMKLGFQCLPSFQPHSLPEYHDGLAHGVHYSSLGTMARSISSRPSSEGISNRHIQGVHLNGHSMEHNEGGYGSSGNGNHSLNQYAWNNSTAYHSHSPSSMMLANSPSFISGINAHQPQQLHGLPRAPSHLVNTSLPMHHHIGSAPTMNNSIWERRHSYAGEPPDASGFHPGSLGNMGLSGTSPMHHFSPHNIFLHAGANCTDSSVSSSNIGLHSPQQKCHMFPGRSTMVPMPNSYDPPTERVRSRRNEAHSNLADNKKQYELNIDRILHGEETRTTLMIKNIPNKYTSKMLLAAIDERHRGTYDFIYLPIDFKNKCNVGYAFINMIDPLQIIPFYQSFNGKKWEKFNSEKVASLAYARIQGKTALVSHFQNSSLMNEDKRCRPILFHSDGPNAGDQEPFPMGVNIRPRMSRMRTSSNEDNHHGSPSNSASGEEYSNGTDTSSAKDLE